MIFYTSDLHFGHANAIKFDERPFTDVDDMADGMIQCIFSGISALN